MAKRFTDTDIWKKQRWFRKLNPIYKLAFCYIKDMCNHAGLWNIECSDLVDDLGLDCFDITDFIDSVNVEFDKATGQKIMKERLLKVSDNLLLITGFIQFQYQGKDGKVSFSAPVKTALQILEGLHNPYITLTQPLQEYRQDLSLLNYVLSKNHITLAEPLSKGYIRPKDKDIINNKLVKHGANRIFSGNNPVSGQEFFSRRVAESNEKLRQSRNGNS